MAKPKVLAIVGPTASGKTSLGIAVARKFNGEIISADSRQIYRGMDIGTAKAPISPAPLGAPAKSSVPEIAKHSQLSGIPVYSDGVPHYLVNIKNPDEEYTVAEFKRDADAAIREILMRGKLPIIVGGTGLYVRAVVENLDIPEIKADAELRARIEKEIADNGLESVFKQLVELDPEAAYVVDPKNPRRVIRALEVAMITGKPFTAQRRKNEPIYDVLEIGINPSPEVLRERIDKRIDEMMKDGLVEEVQNLIKKYGAKQIAFDAIGYREIIEYLEGKTKLEEAITKMKQNTWHFAKRQMTWFKKDKNIKWIENEKEATELAQAFLK